MKKMTSSLFLLVVAGCTTPSTVLVNAEGKAVRCATTGYGYGLAGAIAMGAAQSSHDSCVRDMQRLGYSPLPDAFLGLNLERSAPYGRIKAVTGPAKDVGIVPTDIVLEIGGEKVLSDFDGFKFLGAKRPGEKIQVKVKRGEEEMIFSPVLTSR